MSIYTYLLSDTSTSIHIFLVIEIKILNYNSSGNIYGKNVSFHGREKFKSSPAPA